MKRFTISFFALIVALSMAQVASAQIFYQEQFAGGAIPAGWTTTDASSNTTKVLWSHCSDVTTNCVALAAYGIDPFAGNNAANGFLVSDSDEAGQLQSNHISRVTSAPINCSGQAQVFAVFDNFVGVFATPSTGNVLLRVSNNNGATWTDFDVIPGLSNSNRFSTNPYTAQINISSVAANQAAVLLQWSWTGNYEYWWILDNVRLFNEDPTPRNDLKLVDFFYPASSYATPESQIEIGTFGFFGRVTNNGTLPQPNVKLTAQVLNVTTGAILHEASATFGTVNPGDSVDIDIAGQWVPAVAQGLYRVQYTVSSDSTDARPGDNIDGDNFECTDAIFSKENGPTGAFRPGTLADYVVANYYRMSPLSQENYRAIGFEFTGAVDAGVDLGAIVAEAYLFKVDDATVDPDFAGFETADLFSPSLIWRGTGSFDFPAGAQSYAIQPVGLEDVDNGVLGVNLDNGGRYFACIGYTGAANHIIYHASNDRTRHPFFISSAIYTSQWFLGGFGEDWNPVLRMIIDLVSTTDNTPLPESSMSLFPNPVQDVLNVQVNFEQPTTTTITIADITGRVILFEDRENLVNETLTYNLPQLASGTYLARIATKAGTLTRKFVVQR